MEWQSHRKGILLLYLFCVKGEGVELVRRKTKCSLNDIINTTMEKCYKILLSIAKLVDIGRKLQIKSHSYEFNNDLPAN